LSRQIPFAAGLEPRKTHQRSRHLGSWADLEPGETGVRPAFRSRTTIPQAPELKNMSTASMLYVLGSNRLAVSLVTGALPSAGALWSK
jgi:hypothetical protein